MITIVTALFVIAIDQLTKTLASSGLVRAPWISAGLNPDFALGVAGGPTAIEIAAAAIAFALALVVLRRGPGGPLAALAAGLVIGGSLGNLVDRVMLGAVRDFLVGPKILFNVADVALLVGIAAFVVARNTRRAPGPAITGRTSAR